MTNRIEKEKRRSYTSGSPRRLQLRMLLALLLTSGLLAAGLSGSRSHAEEEPAEAASNEEQTTPTDITAAANAARAAIVPHLVGQTLQIKHWKRFNDPEDRYLPNLLGESFKTEGYQVRVIRLAENDPNSRHSPQNDLEQKLLLQWERAQSRPPTEAEKKRHIASRERLQAKHASPDKDKKPAKIDPPTAIYFAKPAYHAFEEEGEYVYYQPVYISGSHCVVCHRQWNANLDLTEGDLQAVIQIRLPLSKN